MEVKRLKKSKLIALTLILIMFLNMFSPFTNIFTSEVKAAVDGLPNPSVVMRRASDIQTKGTNKYFEVDIALVNDISVLGFDLKFSYDKTKIEPAHKIKKSSVTKLSDAVRETGIFQTIYASNSSYLDTENGIIDIMPYSGEAHNPLQDGYTKENDIDTYTYDAYMKIYTLYFRLVDTSLTENDLTTDLFQLVADSNDVAPGIVPTGIFLSYEKDNVTISKSDVDLFGFDNFVEGKNTSVKNVTLQKLPNKVNYIQGEAIDLTGGELVVELKDGSTKTISMLDPDVTLVSSENADKTKQEVQVTYAGRPVKFTIYVTDPTESISFIQQPTKLSYNYQENIKPDGAIIKVVKKSGELKAITLPDSSVTMVGNVVADLSDSGSSNILGTGTDGNPAGMQTVTLEYDGKQLQYTIAVNQAIQSIKMGTLPKTTYNCGENLSLENGTIIVTTDNGEVILPLTDSGIKITELDGTAYNSKELGTRELLVDYMGQTTKFSVTINDYVEKLIVNGPTKKEYNAGETLDLTGTEIIPVTASGKELAAVPVTEDMLTTTFNSNDIGIQVMKLKYNGLEGSFKLTVNDAPESITVTAPTNFVSSAGQDLDLSNVTMAITMVSGSTMNGISVTKDMISGFDKTKVGKQTVIVTYQGKTDTFEVEVIEAVDSIAIKTTPKVEYLYGENLDVTNGTIEVSYASGTKKEIPITADMVTGYKKNQLASQTLTVTYAGKTATYDVNVKDYVKELKLIPPAIVDYKKGQNLDLTGAKVQEVMASGAATTEVDVTESMLQKAFDNTKLGKQTLVVEYNGLTASFDVNVTNEIVSISLDATNAKLTYKYGEPLDVSNLKLSVTYEDGSSEVVNVTPSMVTGFNSSVVTSAQTLTVTYNGKSLTYQINIIDYVKDIELTKPTKPTYKIGEVNDLSGGSIVEKYASGKTGTPIPLSDPNVVIKGFDTTTEGTKTITVEYTVDGKLLTKTYQILVVDEAQDANLVSLPTKLEYKYGEPLNLKGGKLEIKTESGNTKPIELPDENVKVSGYNPKKLGKQTITLTYEELSKTFTFDVEVKDYVKGITITKPNKVTYQYGEDLNLTGATVSEVMASGAIRNTTPMTGSMISKFNSKQPGTQTITVSYAGFTTTFSVSVAEEVKPSQPTTPTTPSKPTASKPASNKSTKVSTSTKGVGDKVEETQPETKVEEPEVKEPETQNPVQQPNTQTPQEDTQNLQKKDYKFKNDENDNMKKVAIMTIIGLLLLILILMLLKRNNVKIYVEEGGEYAFDGFAKLSNKKLQINLDKYLDEDTKNSSVKLLLNKTITQDLDGQTIEIIRNGKTKEYKVDTQKDKFEIINK